MNYLKHLEDAMKDSHVKMLSTGSTQLNIAISDSTKGGFPVGMYTRICGDTDSGKTFIALACFAEAMISEDFKKYRLIYDPVENGALMDYEKYYGEEMASKLEMPREDGNASQSIEDLYHNIQDAIDKGKPFIYICDSPDALDSRAELKLSAENKKKRDKGLEEKESYGTGKARIHSKKLGPIVAGLKKTKSILILISQSRANLEAIGYGDKKTVSGGHALNFHAAVIIWLSRKATLKTTSKIRGKNRVIGMVSQVKVKRTRITGKKHTIDIPILYDIGIDDVGSNIDYLLDEKEWTKSGGKINAKGLTSQKLRKDDLIAWIERKNKQGKLIRIVGRVWRGIQKSLESGRVNKYRRLGNAK